MAQVHNARARAGLLKAAEWSVGRIGDLLRAWIARRRQRSAILMLEQMDRHRLRDIGMEDLAKPPQAPHTQHWRNQW